MINLFLPPDFLSTDKVIITGDQARHLALVLRVTPGEQIMIVDGTGFQYTCRIVEVHKKEVIVEKISKEHRSAEPSLSISLAQGMPKSDKMDLIVQKATELGVAQIIPLITERSQVRHTEKLDRWRKIALAASQQSGRNRVPGIAHPEELVEFFKGITPCPDRTHLRILFSEESKERNLKKLLHGSMGIGHITILVGPEGGFSRQEISAATEKGFIAVSLGPRIMRTETAPIAAISIVQYELGDIG